MLLKFEEPMLIGPHQSFSTIWISSSKTSEALERNICSRFARIVFATKPQKLDPQKHFRSLSFEFRGPLYNSNVIFAPKARLPNLGIGGQTMKFRWPKNDGKVLEPFLLQFLFNFHNQSLFSVLFDLCYIFDFFSFFFLHNIWCFYVCVD